MKKLLLLAAFLAGPIAFAQTTHMINWFMGVTNAQASMTIDSGDTVMWTWTGGTHTVTTSDGAAETFSSPILSGAGSTYSHTFTVPGNTPYFCDIHPMMTGTITVQSLGLPSAEENRMVYYPNPVRNILTISAPAAIESVSVFNATGQKIFESAAATSEVKLYMDQYPTGTYVVKANSGTNVQTFSVIKE